MCNTKQVICFSHFHNTFDQNIVIQSNQGYIYTIVSFCRIETIILKFHSEGIYECMCIQYNHKVSLKYRQGIWLLLSQQSIINLGLYLTLLHNVGSTFHFSHTFILNYSVAVFAVCDSTLAHCSNYNDENFLFIQIIWQIEKLFFLYSNSNIKFFE